MISMEDVRKGSEQNVERDEELTILIHEKAEGLGYSLISTSIKEKLKSLDDILINEKADFHEREDEDDQEPTNEARIPRVPMQLRKRNEKCFAPTCVSIGPYHHGRYELRLEERRKLKVAATFIKEHRVDKENLYLEIRMKIQDFRKCYEPVATHHFSDDELAWMFLIDGCVVLRIIEVAVNEMLPSRTGDKSHMLESMKSRGIKIGRLAMDLLFLENQLPFQLLEQLISSSQQRGMLQKSIQRFISSMSYIKLEENEELLLQENPTHLLELMRTVFTQSVRTNRKSSFIVRIFEKSIKILGILFHIPRCLIGMLFRFLQRLIIVLLDILPHNQTFKVFTFYKIVELKEAGIKLKPNNTGCLTDISFSHGTLKIPPIIVEDTTAFKFFNIIAYEMYSNVPNNLEFSAYIFFLASLIDRAQDVQELRVNKILYNFLDSDEEVVGLFKNMSGGELLVSFGYNEKYRRILDEIENHCSKKYNAWIAQLRKRYFESPWSVIALLGATIALVLTILQTVYTVLSYYNP